MGFCPPPRKYATAPGRLAMGTHATCQFSYSSSDQVLERNQRSQSLPSPGQAAWNHLNTVSDHPDRTAPVPQPLAGSEAEPRLFVCEGPGAQACHCPPRQNHSRTHCLPALPGGQNEGGRERGLRFLALAQRPRDPAGQARGGSEPKILRLLRKKLSKMKPLCSS